MQKISPYITFSVAYCNKLGLFTVDKDTGKKDYKAEDLWEGILILRNHELRNRKRKVQNV